MFHDQSVFVCSNHDRILTFLPKVSISYLKMWASSQMKLKENEVRVRGIWAVPLVEQDEDFLSWAKFWQRLWQNKIKVSQIKQNFGSASGGTR